MSLYCGCYPSKLDGTEYVAKFDNFNIPASFTWEGVMPPVKNQGKSFTCVCQSLTSILDVIYNSKTGEMRKCNGFSVAELYNSRFNKNMNGMSIKEALHYLRHNGLNGIKIFNYAQVKGIDAARKSILMNGPLVAGFMSYENGTDFFWRKGNKCMGGHAVTIVGYTPTGFIIRNSWGEKWGKNGYLEISNSEFLSEVFEIWTITL